LPVLGAVLAAGSTVLVGVLASLDGEVPVVGVGVVVLGVVLGVVVGVLVVGVVVVFGVVLGVVGVVGGGVFWL
jgi:hypothetical protein